MSLGQRLQLHSFEVSQKAIYGYGRQEKCLRNDMYFRHEPTVFIQDLEDLLEWEGIRTDTLSEMIYTGDIHKPELYFPYEVLYMLYLSICQDGLYFES